MKHWLSLTTSIIVISLLYIITTNILDTTQELLDLARETQNQVTYKLEEINTKLERLESLAKVQDIRGE
jgi:predicted PurR-regulated permease PerM